MADQARPREGGEEKSAGAASIAGGWNARGCRKHLFFSGFVDGTPLAQAFANVMSAASLALVGV
jgi:hypothetical protein